MHESGQSFLVLSLDSRGARRPEYICLHTNLFHWVAASMI